MFVYCVCQNLFIGLLCTKLVIKLMRRAKKLSWARCAPSFYVLLLLFWIIMHQIVLFITNYYLLQSRRFVYFDQLFLYSNFQFSFQFLFGFGDNFLVALVVLFKAYSLLTVSIFRYNLTFILDYV